MPLSGLEDSSNHEDNRGKNAHHKVLPLKRVRSKRREHKRGGMNRQESMGCMLVWAHQSSPDQPRSFVFQ